MDKLLSSWSSSAKSLPESYVFPVDSRPGDTNVPFCNTFPVIDLEAALANDRHDAIQQILKACQDFGFFQVINHGVNNDLVSDTMNVVKEFFNMPNEDKASVYSEDPSKKCRLYTSTYDYDNEKVHLWRDNLRHHCHPIEDFINLWPQKPARYRDVVREYSLQVDNLSSRILELISEGLGLEPGYFGDGLTGSQLFSVNHYPPCPNPNLALGLPKHCDACLITFLLQDEMYGLQVYRNGEWFGVQPIPNAFVVILGHQAQVISNGKLISPEHRAITNSKNHRTSIVYSINPKPDTIIEPAKALINKSNYPLYRAFQFKEFLKAYEVKKDYNEGALEDFKIKEELKEESSHKTRDQGCENQLGDLHLTK
ncbi:2'-deoxymugineic-acid 2'-dioxygenase [Artemisia annua]|uniref:2'-deoxymugineic-acid 2'-dioxygenase n=1 Tax=Artemisia annua TaxID=35608 RepID=A0A2U1Q694_ARTAN|nr:2'-deoxymugineic-acid 2'-dioxygenase [Artemisia annua]